MKRYNIINNTLGWLCFFIAAATYLLTIEPTASFWDCPEFISQGAKLEVGHPPGNPIFMLTARFFVTIFGGDITRAALAVNSMSALLSAATILLLFWTITHLVKKIVVRDNSEEISLPSTLVIMGAGLCGALAYTWSDTFWYSAVEGEVYAFSSFCTALVFWLILKWENRADQPYSDRYLVLIAYIIGVSIAVHLLNLLCIPAIVLVFYYRKSSDVTAKGSCISLLVSFVLVALILFGLVPGFVKVAQGFELFFVNSMGLSYNMGVLIYAIVLLVVFISTTYAIYARKRPVNIKTGVLLTLMLSGLTFMTDSYLVWTILTLAAAVYLFFFCRKIPYRIFAVGMLSIFVIFIGYSSYALLLIRASANTPMNQNAPDNVFTLSSYLNREQYGKTPLLYGPVFAEEINVQKYPISDDQTVALVTFDQNGELEAHPADVTLRDNSGMAIDNGHLSYVKKAKASPDEPDEYVKESYALDYATSPDVNMIFTRMHSSAPEHIQGYKDWSGYLNDIDRLPLTVPAATLRGWEDQGYVPIYELSPFIPNQKSIRIYKDGAGMDKQVWTPSFADNLRYFFNYQLNHMYWRYFMWNFAGRQNDIQGNGEPHLGNWISGIPFIDNMRLGDQSLLPDEFGAGNKGHNVFYMLPLLLGVIGLLWQSLFPHPVNTSRGIEQFWVVFFLFFMTGVAIVLYLNQTPGQPRERDYAFAGSFYAFAIWIGMGVPAIAAFIRKIFGGKNKADKKATGAESRKVQLAAAVVACVIGIAVPLQMVSQTWDDHDRSHRYTTRDFGANYLNSLDPDAIIFTNGDNDTFPLWYAQEVEGVRTDVRVVNLSYLATDWYANQMTHPYYDAPAVKFTARPTDYAYDRLAYSLGNNKVDTAVVAIDALKKFYDSPGIIYGNQPIKVLETQLMVSPVDSAQVFEAFNLDIHSIDSITKIPYISDITMNGLAGGGFTLSKLLSFDIVANSVADGFKRPVYFATTVPESFYLGLRPYFGLTGMAYQVTPFEKAPASPLADKAYENMVSKFRWGGLDDTRYNKGLYLDETIRRMVASTRNSMIQTAEDLMVNGNLPATEFAKEWAAKNGQAVPATRYDMARYLLNLMEEKLPDYVAPYDGSTEVLAVTDYLRLYDATGNPDDLARAERIIDNGIDRYAQLARYALAQTPATIINMGYTGSLARYFLPMYIGFKNYVTLRHELAKDPEANAEYIAAIKNLASPEMRLVTYPMLYLRGADSAKIESLTDLFGPSMTQGAVLSDIHKALGIDQMKITREVLPKYGLTPETLLTLNQYAAYLN